MGKGRNGQPVTLTTGLDVGLSLVLWPNNPTSPPPTPYQRLDEQYYAVMAIEPGDTEGLFIGFHLFRERLWSVIEVASDALTYKLS